MSMALELFWRKSLVAVPIAVAFFTWMAVGPYFHLISERVMWIGTSVWALTKMMPYFALAAMVKLTHPCIEQKFGTCEYLEQTAL